MLVGFGILVRHLLNVIITLISSFLQGATFCVALEELSEYIQHIIALYNHCVGLERI